MFPRALHEPHNAPCQCQTGPNGYQVLVRARQSSMGRRRAAQRNAHSALFKQSTGLLLGIEEERMLATGLKGRQGGDGAQHAGVGEMSVDAFQKALCIRIARKQEGLDMRRPAMRDSRTRCPKTPPECATRRFPFPKANASPTCDQAGPSALRCLASTALFGRAIGPPPCGRRPEWSSGMPAHGPAVAQQGTRHAWGSGMRGRPQGMQEDASTKTPLAFAPAPCTPIPLPRPGPLAADSCSAQTARGAVPRWTMPQASRSEQAKGPVDETLRASRRVLWDTRPASPARGGRGGGPRSVSEACWHNTTST